MHKWAPEMEALTFPLFLSSGQMAQSPQTDQKRLVMLVSPKVKFSATMAMSALAIGPSTASRGRTT